MTRRIIIGVGLGVALMTALAPAHAAEKRVGLTSFEQIVLNGDFAVEVTTRAPLGAVISGSTDALDRVEIRNSDGVVTINDRRYASDRQRGDGAGPVTIRINAATVRSVAVASAGSLSIDRLRGARVELSLRGPGSLNVGMIAADRVSLGVVGNGSVRVAGTVKAGDALVSGAAVIDASGLAVTDLVINGEGAADQRYRASRTAQITLRGMGRVAIMGKAKCTIRNLGSGTVTCG